MEDETKSNHLDEEPAVRFEIKPHNDGNGTTFELMGYVTHPDPKRAHRGDRIAGTVIYRFATESPFLQSALNELAMAVRLEYENEVRRLVQEGLDSGPGLEAPPEYWAEKKQKFIERKAAERANERAIPVDPASMWADKGVWPDPTPEMLASPEFERVWQCIKSWDINVPEVHKGYSSATGNHVRAILDALEGQPRTIGHATIDVAIVGKEKFEKALARITELEDASSPSSDGSTPASSTRRSVGSGSFRMSGRRRRDEGAMPQVRPALRARPGR